MHCPLAECPLPSPVQPEEEEDEEDLQHHALGDALLGSPSLSPPPSYESTILTQTALSGPAQVELRLQGSYKSPAGHGP